MKLALKADQSPRFEPTQLKRPVIQRRLGFGVRRQKHLEAAIQEKAVNLVGGNATTYPVRRLPQPTRQPRRGQIPRSHQAGQAAANNDHIHFRAHPVLLIRCAARGLPVIYDRQLR